MSDTPTESIKAPVTLYVIWVVATLLMAIANRYIGLLVLALGAIHILTYPSRTRAYRIAQSAKARNTADKAAEIAAEISKLQTGPLEPIEASDSVSRILKNDEECYWEEPAVEWRLQTYVDLGSTTGALTTTRVVPEQVGPGTLAITDQRLIFQCNSHVYDLLLNAIPSVGYFADGIRVVAGRGRQVLFLTGNDRAGIVLRRAIEESGSETSADAVAELKSHCATCGAPLRLIHHVCEFCGARVSQSSKP